MRRLENPQTALLKLREGEPRGLAWFFKKYYIKMCYFAIAILGNKTATEKAVGNVFLQFWLDHNTFYHPSDVHVFLYYKTRDECFRLLEIETHIKRVEKDSPYWDETAELMLKVMKAIEAPELRKAIQTLFAIEFHNRDIHFIQPDYKQQAYQLVNN